MLPGETASAALSPARSRGRTRADGLGTILAVRLPGPFPPGRGPRRFPRGRRLIRSRPGRRLPTFRPGRGRGRCPLCRRPRAFLAGHRRGTRRPGRLRPGPSPIRAGHRPGTRPGRLRPGLSHIGPGRHPGHTRRCRARSIRPGRSPEGPVSGPVCGLIRKQAPHHGLTWARTPAHLITCTLRRSATCRPTRCHGVLGRATMVPPLTAGRGSTSPAIRRTDTVTKPRRTSRPDLGPIHTRADACPHARRTPRTDPGCHPRPCPGRCLA